MDDESARSSSPFPVFESFDPPLTRNTQSFSQCSAEIRSIHTGYPQSLQHYVPEYPRTEDYAPMDSMRNDDHPAYYAQTGGSGQFSSSRMPLQTSYSLQDALQDYSSTQVVSGRPSWVPFQSDTGYAEKDNNPSPSILINSRVSHSTSQFAPYALPLPNSPHEAPSAMNSELNCMASFEGPARIDTSSSTIPAKKKKKAKMHQCEICSKEFPRPSGLKTHMNSHNNNKPFPCTFPGCTRTFTVRSNAKRHLRTHGINPEDADSMFPRSSSADFEVNFDEPMVQTQEHEFNNAIPPLKWMPPTSVSALVNTESLTAVPEDTDSDWEESKEDPVLERNFGQISIPLRPVLSYAGQDSCEERNSYEEAADPHHASQTSQRDRMYFLW